MVAEKRQKFQSHLYGIESSYACLGINSLTRFNRTFMELKALRIMVFAQSGLFQSHLYGIESCVASAFHGKPPVSIAPLWNWKPWRTIQRRHGISFNRTFMELKENMPHTSVISMSSFQSHLYGIERCIIYLTHRNLAQFQSHLYGIERYIVSDMMPSVAPFQSHLYGIESEKMVTREAMSVVSIAPLWNWKCR